MKSGPDIALVAALLGDPARANMLTALVGGQALTAGELARTAGVTAQTASSHLARLEAGRLVTARKQGRHRYFALADDDVAQVLEGLMGLAERAGHSRTRTGPREPDHLAGDLAVAMLDGLIAQGRVAETGEDLALTASGAAFVRDFGIDLDSLGSPRRPVCKACLDWSVRRSHLAGALGAAILTRLYSLGWASRVEGARIVRFTPRGLSAFSKAFGLA
jgi:DNA-binding transcriptional ArsR family regulator